MNCPKPNLLRLLSLKKARMSEYRFGFNGKEKIDEINGAGNDMDFGARIYDARICRWLSLDPLQGKHPLKYIFC